MSTYLPDPRPEAWPDREDLIGFEGTEFYPLAFAEEDERIAEEMKEASAENEERAAKMRSRAEDYGTPEDYGIEL